MKTSGKTKTSSGSKKRQLHNDKTGSKKAYTTDYSNDYDTKDEVKESEDNWNNEGGAITTNDKGFENPQLSYDNTKSRKRIRKPYSTKVRVSKVSKTKDKNGRKKRRA